MFAEGNLNWTFPELNPCVMHSGHMLQAVQTFFIHSGHMLQVLRTFHSFWSHAKRFF
jgi:hypothetical protein